MTDSADGPKEATPVTQKQNRAALGALPFADTEDWDDARRGFLGTLPEVEIRNADGRVVWSLRDYAFLADEQAPPTVHPSLWRQARLNMTNGLFHVTDRIYWVFPDLARSYVLTLEHCALTYLADRRSASADTTVTLDRTVLNRLVLREVSLADAVEQGLVAVDGDAAKVFELFGLLDDFSLMFEVIEPKRQV